MALTVNTNIFSLAAQKNVSRTQSSLQTAIERLSSGLRINQAKDDAAGLAVAQLQEAQGRGHTVAQRNIADGISYLDVADATLRSVSDMMQRMRELSVQGASGLYSTAQTAAMQVEFDALSSEVAAAQSRATFNGTAVFGGGGAVQVGANDGETISITANTVAVTAVFGTVAGSDTDLNAVATELANIGSFQSRLEQASRVSAAIEQASYAAAGRVMDADFAQETSRMTSSQVVMQAGVAALAQANTIPQLVLGLLR